MSSFFQKMTIVSTSASKSLDVLKDSLMIGTDYTNRLRSYIRMLWLTPIFIAINRLEESKRQREGHAFDPLRFINDSPQ